VDEIERLVQAGAGGSIFTPNVDHVVQAETNAAFREAYTAASLCLADGQPLVWMSRLLGAPIPERIAGSDLVIPLMDRAARNGWAIYLLGGGPGVAEAAALELKNRYGAQIAGVDCPTVSLGPSSDEDSVIERVRAAHPDIVLVALGAPKQELWIHRASKRIRPAVAIGVGAALDFIVGRVPRAPRWMSAAGLEWLYRLMREPRLAHRYLVRDPKIVPILLRTLRLPREQRVR
jgi:N-acetylglucosaminyldiphosphoundecaprenol N-acetyl-beta-D-mannosaminyltransferase